MDYTNSQYYTQHANGQRMHSDTSTPATVLSDDDINSIMWSLMEVIKAGNQTAQTFNPEQAATYQVLREAIKDLIKQQKQSVFINDTQIPSTYQGDIIALKLPHLRWFVWTGAGYVRAPWHQPGQLGFFAHNNTIPGWLPARGDVTYNKADYPDFCASLGISGTGTFSVVELRGQFIRCLDNGRGVDVNRTILSSQDDAIRNITGRIAGAVVEEGSNATGAFGKFGSFPGANNNYTDHGISFDASRVVPVANENRPYNTAFATHISI